MINEQILKECPLTLYRVSVNVMSDDKCPRLTVKSFQVKQTASNYIKFSGERIKLNSLMLLQSDQNEFSISRYVHCTEDQLEAAKAYVLAGAKKQAENLAASYAKMLASFDAEPMLTVRPNEDSDD